jgi:hypothetical protein
MKEALTLATDPSGAIQTIRCSVGAPTTTAQTVWPRSHSDFGVVQSEDANVCTVSLCA